MTEQAPPSSGTIGFWQVAAIGIGGMVGGGIFAVLGLAVQLAGGGTPVAFALAGVVALLTAYAYARLSVTFPSQGGTVTFLNHAFGDGMATGTLNVLLWLSYIVMLSLYAFAFGSYGAALFGVEHSALWKHFFITLAVVAIAGLNLRGAGLIGAAETWIVAAKLLILMFFGVVGAFSVQAHRLAFSTWTPPPQLLAGGMIIFMAYEGFELIANAAQDVKNPTRTLPRALYSSVIFVIGLYVLISVVAVGNLPIREIVDAKDYALAEAARPFLGQAGFALIAFAAMLSTASAINATLYGAARLSFIIAQDGQLPVFLERKVWNKPVMGLLITAGLTLITANIFDLSSISMMGSAGFLLIFAAVNAANIVLAAQTKSRRWLSALGVAACLTALLALLWQTATTAPAQLWVLAAMIALAAGIEIGYRLSSGRRIRVAARVEHQN